MMVFLIPYAFALPCITSVTLLLFKSSRRFHVMSSGACVFVVHHFILILILIIYYYFIQLFNNYLPHCYNTSSVPLLIQMHHHHHHHSSLLLFLFCVIITAAAISSSLASIDDIPLNRYPMIFSHDAGMGYADPSLEDLVRWSKNQIGDIQQQLECGARAFDFRGACRDDGIVRLHHGIFVIDVPLQRALEDLIAWAGRHPDELLLVQYQQYLPDSDQCRKEVWNVSESLGLMKSFGGSGLSCDRLRGLTVGDAKRLGRLSNGGHVFVFEAGDCTLGRGDVECYTEREEEENDGASQNYIPCFGDGNPPTKVREMVDTLIELFSKTPPEDGRITTTAAHWQYDFKQFNGIMEHHSSLLMDEYFSDLHYWIAANIDKMEYIGLLGLDNVCDRGHIIYDKLLQRINNISSLHR